jgi:hypothetical protein
LYEPLGLLFLIVAYHILKVRISLFVVSLLLAFLVNGSCLNPCGLSFLRPPGALPPMPAWEWVM